MAAADRNAFDGTPVRSTRARRAASAPPLTRARRNPKNWSQDVVDYISDDRFARFDAGPSHVRALAGVLRLQIIVVSDAGGTTLYPANGAPPHDFVLSEDGPAEFLERDFVVVHHAKRHYVGFERRHPIARACPPATP